MWISSVVLFEWRKGALERGRGDDSWSEDPRRFADRRGLEGRYSGSSAGEGGRKPRVEALALLGSVSGQGASAPDV